MKIVHYRQVTFYNINATFSSFFYLLVKYFFTSILPILNIQKLVNKNNYLAFFPANTFS